MPAFEGVLTDEVRVRVLGMPAGSTARLTWYAVAAFLTNTSFFTHPPAPAAFPIAQEIEAVASYVLDQVDKW